MDFDKNLADFGYVPEEVGSMSGNAAAFLKAYARTSTVFNEIAEVASPDEKREIMRQYLDFCYEMDNDTKRRKGNNIISLGFNDPGFESITYGRLPNVGDFSGVTLVEFFTHCCINCIHSIEDVRAVHEEVGKKYAVDYLEDNGSMLRVVSIHSPKFPREKDMESIKAFCKRMKMEHSQVVNDPNCIIWNEFGVTCWPTILILGPNPSGDGVNLLFTLIGEGHKEDLQLAVQTSIEFLLSDPNFKTIKNQDGFGETLTSSSQVDATDAKKQSTKFLRFPGKVAVYGEQTAIADSGNNRVIVALSSGQITEIIGGSGKGKVDGEFKLAKFYNPQGLAFQTDFILFVADTGNHVIRKVDLKEKKVTTLVDIDCGAEVDGKPVYLKSPWDLCFYDSNSMIIAAAGNHRLFGYFFENVTLFGARHSANSLAVIAGSGHEENRNNSYIMKASFAQPSGLAVSHGDEKCIYIADSESSSIRSITSKGQVVAIAGGSRNPTDLFAFGDADGQGFNAKLQHPMGVCCGLEPNEIYVADTYNHKIKRIVTTTRDCQTFISDDLNEPSGLSIDAAQGFLYIADTNHHSIKVMDIKTESVREMQFYTSASVGRLKFDKVFEINSNGGDSSKTLNFRLSPLPESFEGGRWKITSDTSTHFSTLQGSIDKDHPSNEGRFTIVLLNGTKDFVVTTDVFYCGLNSCLKTTRKIKITVSNAIGQDKLECSEDNLVWGDMSWEL